MTAFQGQKHPLPGYLGKVGWGNARIMTAHWEFLRMKKIFVRVIISLLLNRIKTFVLGV